MTRIVTQNYRDIDRDPDRWSADRLQITLQAMAEGLWQPDSPNFLCPRCICVMEPCKLVLFRGWHCPLCDGYIGWDYGDAYGLAVRGDLYDPHP